MTVSTVSEAPRTARTDEGRLMKFPRTLVLALTALALGVPAQAASASVRSVDQVAAGSALSVAEEVTDDAPAIAAVGVHDVIVRGSGWGHSVGMSQYGAQGMALYGRDYAEILGHYYPGIDLVEHPAADTDIRVNLFLNRPVNTNRLVLQTAAHGVANAPTRNVRVDLGGGNVHEIPHNHRWELRHTDGAFVLRDFAGEVQGRGLGPVRVDYEFSDGEPTLLRLPQLVTRPRRTQYAGTYRWGHLEITASGGELRPVMVTTLERYLRGLAEVPSGWHAETLKAQATAGRGYAVRQVLGGVSANCGCHLGTTPHHQYYTGYGKEAGDKGDAWVTAVDATTGEVPMYDGELAWTYYSSSHGGRSDNSGESWAYGTTLPYLRSVDDHWSQLPEVNNPNDAWERRISNADFAAAVGLARVDEVAVVSRTDGGTPRQLEIHGARADGTPVVIGWTGSRKGIAGSDLKLHFRALLPSQQIESITVE